jgi:hypothetical protein
MSYRILYAGNLGHGGTCLYRLETLQRLGQEVIPFDTQRYLGPSRILSALQYRYPMGPLIARINRDLLAVARREKPAIVWFDKPVQFTPQTLRCLQEQGIFTLCFHMDNPFVRQGSYARWEFFQLHRILPLLDLHCLFRQVDIPRYQAMGLKHIKIQLSYDPMHHFPPPPEWSDAGRTRALSYIGSPFDDRPRFLRSLALDYHLPLTISGPRWHKFLTAQEMKRLTRGSWMLDEAYRRGIWASRINLSFVTEMNEEDVAHKAFEIAACGGFLLALRTPGHQACFEEGREAEFFSTIEECAEKARYYLEHPAEREEIARRGCERARLSGYDNDTQLNRVLEEIKKHRATGVPRR